MYLLVLLMFNQFYNLFILSITGEKVVILSEFKLNSGIQNQIFTAYLKIDLHDKYNQVRYSR